MNLVTTKIELSDSTVKPVPIPEHRMDKSFFAGNFSDKRTNVWFAPLLLLYGIVGVWSLNKFIDNKKSNPAKNDNVRIVNDSLLD